MAAFPQARLGPKERRLCGPSLVSRRSDITSFSISYGVCVSGGEKIANRNNLKASKQISTQAALHCHVSFVHRSKELSRSSKRPSHEILQQWRSNMSLMPGISAFKFRQQIPSVAILLRSGDILGRIFFTSLFFFDSCIYKRTRFPSGLSSRFTVSFNLRFDMSPVRRHARLRSIPSPAMSCFLDGMHSRAS